MANVNHSTLTDPYLHEPKGVAAATTGQVYVANGSGSGNWINNHNYINGYLPFDSSTPAYQHSVTTSFTVLDPTFSVAVSSGWSGAASPNARLIYTASEDIVASLKFTISIKNDSGTNRDLELAFYKNGTIMNNGHIVITAASGEWRDANLTAYEAFETNDYIEVFVKGSASFTLDVASASLNVMGVPS